MAAMFQWQEKRQCKQHADKNGWFFRVAPVEVRDPTGKQKLPVCKNAPNTSQTNAPVSQFPSLGAPCRCLPLRLSYLLSSLDAGTHHTKHRPETKVRLEPERDPELVQGTTIPPHASPNDRVGSVTGDRLHTHRVGHRCRGCPRHLKKVHTSQTSKSIDSK